jgi:eukaryotic-like serine/threonine-protein kinase
MIGESLFPLPRPQPAWWRGMGVVYEAEDTPPPSSRRAPVSSRGRCRRSARSRVFPARGAHAASALNHPNICTIYKIHEVGGPLLHRHEAAGRANLQRLIANRPLPLNQLLDLSLQITDALDAAHSKDIDGYVAWVGALTQRRLSDALTTWFGPLAAT